MRCARTFYYLYCIVSCMPKCNPLTQYSKPLISETYLSLWGTQLPWNETSSCDWLLDGCSNRSVSQGKKIIYIYIYIYLFIYRGRRVIGISRSLIWSKTLMELIFNACGEFRWSPEGPVSQIHSSNLHVGAPGIF